MADRVAVLLLGVQQNAPGGKDPERCVFRPSRGGRGELTKAPGSLQELSRRIDRKAKSEATQRGWGLLVHLTQIETLAEADRIAKGNGGAPGIDGQRFQDIESAGRVAFLRALREDLVTGSYKPLPKRRVELPKGHGKVRTLQLPCIRDRVVQGALKLILEAVFEADFCPNSYGFRPKRSPQRALAEVRRSVLRRMSTVIDVGLSRGLDRASGHDPATGASGPGRQAAPGPTAHAPREADHPSWRKGWGPARGPVQPVDGEYLFKRGRLVLRRDWPHNGRRGLRGGQLASVRRCYGQHRQRAP